MFPRILSMGLALLSLSAITLSSADPDKKPAFKSVTPESRKAAWWTKRHDKKLADLKTQKAVDLLMIGDSITHGWENRGKATWSEFYAKRNAFNICYSGDRTEHVIWRLQHGEIDAEGEGGEQHEFSVTPPGKPGCLVAPERPDLVQDVVLGDRHRERRGHGGIHRVASLLQHLDPGRHRLGIFRRHRAPFAGGVPAQVLRPGQGR